MAAKIHVQWTYLRNQWSDRLHFRAYLYHIDYNLSPGSHYKYKNGWRHNAIPRWPPKNNHNAHISGTNGSMSFQRLLYYIDYNLSLGSCYKDKNWWRHHAIQRWLPKNTSGDLSKTPETSVRPQETSAGPQETLVRAQGTWRDLSRSLRDLSKTPGDLRRP